MKYYLAVDIGASSGRHIVGWNEDGQIHTKEVYRFPNGVQEQNGHLVWDVQKLFSNVVMDHQNSGEAFNYTYSAKEQAELRDIRSKYLPPEEDKMEKLRRLHNSATREGSAKALTVGILGALLLGMEMCCCMVWKRLVRSGHRDRYRRNGNRRYRKSSLSQNRAESP